MILNINGKSVDISKYKGYKSQDFNPDQIFDCGQCFRWSKNSEGIWETPEDINSKAQDSQGPSIIEFQGQSSKASHGQSAYEENLARYFDFNRDYGEIKKYLAKGDPIMAKAIKEGSGIRILNQPKWETLISFIISQNNNIPRIKGCINSLAAKLGENGQLPSPQVLAEAKISHIADCKLGYRDKYLIETAKQISQEPQLLQQLASDDVSRDEAVEVLQKLSGVGPKVANCIALFCLGKVDCFPLDVWMKRVMNRLYGIAESDTKEMKRYAEEHFAPYGGIAQQYLFYFITHKGVDK